MSKVRPPHSLSLHPQCKLQLTLPPHHTEDIKNVIQDFYQILVQVSNYDAAGRPTRDALAQDLSAPSPNPAPLFLGSKLTPNPPSQPNPRRNPAPPAHHRPLPPHHHLLHLNLLRRQGHPRTPDPVRRERPQPRHLHARVRRAGAPHEPAGARQDARLPRLPRRAG